MKNRYRAILFDLSGVLYVDNTAIPGAADLIKELQSTDIKLRFVTNTSRKTRDQVLADLSTLGYSIDPETLFTAPFAARAYVQQKQLRPWCLVHADIQSEFADLDQDKPNAVILGDAADDLNYANLNQAFRLCMDGAALIGIGDNRYFRQDGKLCLDAGPFIHAIEFAARCEAVIMGKPSIDFFHQVLSTTAALPEDSLMIGDDVFGDIEGALQAGMDACLVRTGKYQSGDENKLSPACHCLDSVADLKQWLASIN